MTLRAGSRSGSVLVAIGVGADGHRQILGVAEGQKEDLEGWRGFLRHLKDRARREYFDPARKISLDGIPQLPILIQLPASARSRVSATAKSDSQPEPVRLSGHRDLAGGIIMAQMFVDLVNSTG